MTSTMDEYRVLVDRSVADNHGTLVNFVGDNFMAVFGDAVDAMGTAIAITSGIESRNADRASAARARFRMGMDHGAIAVWGNEYFGDALNISARIQGLAQPGGISVSGRVYRALDEPALRFRPIGRRHLKGIPEDVDIYEFADLPSDASAATAPRALGLHAPSVAVLPIHADTVDDSVRGVANIIRTDLIHRLARIPQLKIVDADTVPAPGGTPRDRTLHDRDRGPPVW